MNKAVNIQKASETKKGLFKLFNILPLEDCWETATLSGSIQIQEPKERASGQSKLLLSLPTV